MPTRWQTITWTSSDKVPWHHVASLGHREFIRCHIIHGIFRWNSIICFLIFSTNTMAHDWKSPFIHNRKPGNVVRDFRENSRSKAIMNASKFGEAYFTSWWRHQMETFSTLLALCAGKSPIPGEFHTQRPVTRSFDVFFDLCLNKRLSKQSWGWWFETQSRPLWRHGNVNGLCLRRFGQWLNSSRPSDAYMRGWNYHH